MIALLGFEWLRPAYALGLLVVPLALVLALVVMARRRRARLLLGDASLVREIAGERSALLSRVRLVAELLGLLLIAVALIGPSRGFTRRLVERRSLDLVVCVDTSRSMLAEDLRPNRLDRARREVSGLLDQLAGDRVGLLAFSGDVREVAPLTRDRQTLKALLGELTPAENRRGGTNLGAALGRALDIFDGRTGAHEAIVVLTDGEDLEGGGADFAKRAEEAGIGIYVVGIGTEAGGKIPVTDAAGRTSFVKGPDGEEVVSKLDRASLNRLAETSGGAFLTTSDSATPLEEMYMKRIAKLSGRAAASGEEKVPSDRYQWALLPGFVLLVLGLGLSERRKRRATRAGMRLVGLLALTFLLAPRANAAEGSAQVDGAEADSVAVELAEPSLTEVLTEAIAAAESADWNAAMVGLTRAIGDVDLDAAQSAAEEAGAESEGSGAPQVDEEPAPRPEPRESRWSEREEAELHFARGVVGHGAGQLGMAAGDFSKAAALAGPGELRRDATYNMATALFGLAEAKRAEASQPPTPPAPGQEAGDKEDPIEAQRRLYIGARGVFLERLRLDPSDEDTRADLELIVRRLRELDQQEEQQKQDQEQQDQDQQDQQDQQQQDQQDQQQQDQEQQDQQDQDKQDQQKSDKEREENKPQPEPETEEKKDETQPSEAEPQKAQPVGELSKEQLARLIDQLQKMEDEQADLERRLRKVGRVPVKRDW